MQCHAQLVDYPSMMSDEDLTCSHCGRTYSRSEHLQRHLLSISSQTWHRCPRCQKSFKRKDVLRRHLHTCSGRSTVSPTYYDRACERCAGKKRRCSRGRPSCKQCMKISALCRYPNEVDNGVLGSGGTGPKAALPSHDETFIVDAEEVSEAFSPISAGTPTRLSVDWLESVHHSPFMGASLQVCFFPTLSSKKFSFLLEFTTQYSLKGSFGTPSNVITRSLYVDASHYDTADGCEKRRSREAGFDATFPSLITSSYLMAPGCDTTDQHSTASHVGMPRQSVSRDIYAAVEPILQRRHQTMSRHCSKLFAPDSITAALERYWSHWHPNWPVKHKPTFSIEKTPSVLLAAMVIVGTCYWDPNHARDWFDVVEDFAFYELQSMPRSASLYQKIQAIQAAYLACIFQTWDGEVGARTRIRRHRFGCIVTAVRDLDMSTVKHSDVPVQHEQFDWVEFVRMEECIRTLLWVFQLDTAYVIFNNMPPQLALRELNMGLASPEMSFQASSSSECYAVLRDWLTHNVRTSDRTLYGLIKSFFSPSLNDTMFNNFAHESFMNLWCVDAAFHVVLFNLDPVLGGEQQLTGLRIGIDNWEAVWNRRMINNDERFFDSIITTADFAETSERVSQSWQCPGFWKNAAEYWLLARVILEKMAAAHGSAVAADELSGCTGLHVNISQHVHDKIEDAEMRSLHSFLTGLSTTSSSLR